MFVPALLLALVAPSSTGATFSVPPDTTICECSAGHVILGGHDVAAPYTVSLHAGQLTINGLRIVMPQPRRIAVTDAVRARHALKQRVYGEVERSWSSRSEAAITERARATFQASALVDSVRVRRPLWLRVWWKHDRDAELLDLHLMPPRPDPWPETLADAAGTCRTLESGGLVILASTGRVIVPSARVDTVLREIRRLRNGEAPVTNNGVLSQDIRREVCGPARLEKLPARRHPTK